MDKHATELGWVRPLWQQLGRNFLHQFTSDLHDTSRHGFDRFPFQSLSNDVLSLSELQYLDLSNNNGLIGTLPSSIWNLNQLTTLILIGCSFFGPIPDSIGSLQQLVFLALNVNSFSGPIPPSIGNLSNLSWLDLTENQLNGTIPVSSGSTTGPGMLVKTRHLIFDIIKLTGSIPDTLGYVQTLEAMSEISWRNAKYGQRIQQLRPCLA